MLWVGPTPRVTVTDPKLIREVLNRYNEFHKPEANAFIHLFVTGLASYDGEKWDSHRKILNPAFHVEKLKVLISTMVLISWLDIKVDTNYFINLTYDKDKLLLPSSHFT